MMKQRTIASVILAAGMVFGVGAFLASPAPAFAVAAAEDAVDILVLKNGTKVEGKIISETATSIRFKGTIGGIPFESEYQKSDIESIQRGVKKDAAADAATSAGSTNAGTTPAKDATPVDPDATKVYFIPLRGEFGEDVSQTPILQAIRDAKAQGASVIVLEMDTTTGATHNPFMGERMTLPDQMAWNGVGRAEQIFPVFHTRMREEWEQPPRVAMVIKRATGAAAFFPFAFSEIYFTPNGVWGGIGTLSELFSGVGDEPVQEKQKSLRLGHVEGWAIFGKHDYRLVRAMARREYVLSFKVVGGKAELYERMPEDPSEETLTDDGKETNADVIKDYLEGTGNDVLTLTPRIAQILGVSKGTVDNTGELLAAMGIDRNAVVIRDRGDRIMKQWTKSMDNAKVQLAKLLNEFRDVRVEPPGDYDARTKARGTQLNKLRQMKSILARFDEGLSDWAQQNLPGIPQIETVIKQIELEQSLDRR